MELFDYEWVRQESLSRFITKIYLRPLLSSHLSYEAGQYIKVLHRDETVSPLSIASPPNSSGTIELHLSHPPENNTAADILEMLASDQQLTFRGAYGTCTVSKLDLSRPIIFVMRETGFAPVKAIVEQLILDNKSVAMHFYWSGENYLASLIESWMQQNKQIEYTPLTTYSISEKILEDYPDLTHHQVYAVDAGNVVHEVLFNLMEHGLAKEDFYSDVIDYNPTL